MRTQLKNGLIGLALAGLALGGTLAFAQGGRMLARGQQHGQGFGRGGPFQEERGFGDLEMGMEEEMGMGMENEMGMENGLMAPLHGGWGGLFGAMRSVGTTTTVTFYDGDPAAGGQELSSQSFTAGEDSESAFMQAVSDARQNASFMVVETSEQSRTVDLSTLGDTPGAWALRGLPLRLRGLNDGSTVTVTFYDGDPAAGGQELSSNSFTLGQDSELAFQNALEQAAQDASYATVMLSPQTRTVDLSSTPAQEGMMERGWR